MSSIRAETGKKPRCRYWRNAAIAIGACFAFVVLLFAPPVDRMLGGLFALSADGATIAAFPAEIRRQADRHKNGYVSYRAIPACLDQAIISVEDKRFPWHGGVDPLALIRVAVESVENDNVDHGGSTIAVQLARRILRIPRRQPGPIAEFESELRIVRGALIIEHDFDKDTILELYLNGVYFGRGATGAAAAAAAYFNAPLDRLNQAQCIYLAGLPNAPARFGADPAGKSAMARYRHVIATMERNGYLTDVHGAALSQTQLFSPGLQN